MTKFFALILSLLSWTALAYEVPDSCVQCLKDESKLESLAKITLPYKRLQFLETKAQALYDSHFILRRDLAPIARTLRDGDSEPTHKEARAEIAEIKKDFDRLTILQKESLIQEKKFNFCLFNCSPVWKMEIQDNIKNLQKLKTALFLKRPILANKFFEKRLKDMDDAFADSDKLYDDKTFEKDLKDAAFDSIASITVKLDEYGRYLHDGQKPFNRAGNESYITTYLDKAAGRFPGLIEDVVRSSEDNSEGCYFANEYKKYSDSKRRQEIAIDAGILIVPLMIGPLGLEAGMAARLAVWGLRANEVRKISAGAAMIMEVGMVAKDRHNITELEKECRRKETVLFDKATASALTEMEACREKLGEELFLSNLSLIPGGLLPLKLLTKPVAPFIAKTAASSDEISLSLYQRGLNDLKTGQAAVEFKTQKNGVFTVMDLGDLKSTADPAMKKLPEEYWRYVAGIYNERLNLTPKEIEGFIESSLQMSPRTKLIINTEKSALGGDKKIKGGVGIVEAASPKDLLPFEKATGVRVQKKPNEKIAEIVRLTVGKEQNAVELSQDLVNQAVNLIRHDKEISRTFIFTSKVHSRLYRRMGIPADKIKTLDDRDVMIELTREDLDKIAKAKFGY